MWHFFQCSLTKVKEISSYISLQKLTYQKCKNFIREEYELRIKFKRNKFFWLTQIHFMGKFLRWTFWIYHGIWFTIKPILFALPFILEDRNSWQGSMPIWGSMINFFKGGKKWLTHIILVSKIDLLSFYTAIEKSRALFDFSSS